MKSSSLKATHTLKEDDCTENDGGVGYFYIMKNSDRWARKVNARITFICDLSDHLKIICKMCDLVYTPMPNAMVKVLLPILDLNPTVSRNRNRK